MSNQLIGEHIYAFNTEIILLYVLIPFQSHSAIFVIWTVHLVFCFCCSRCLFLPPEMPYTALIGLFDGQTENWKWTEFGPVSLMKYIQRKPNEMPLPSWINNNFFFLSRFWFVCHDSHFISISHNLTYFRRMCKADTTHAYVHIPQCHNHLDLSLDFVESYYLLDLIDRFI